MKLQFLISKTILASIVENEKAISETLKTVSFGLKKPKHTNLLGFSMFYEHTDFDFQHHVRLECDQHSNTP